MSDPEILAPNVIYMLPDDAESVIWFPNPVPYAKSGVSIGLVQAMQLWELSYYRGRPGERDWSSPSLRDAFEAEGARLAELLIMEVGRNFIVELPRMEPESEVRRFASSAAALNLDAEAAFMTIAASVRTRRAKLSDWRSVHPGAVLRASYIAPSGEPG